MCSFLLKVFQNCPKEPNVSDHVHQHLVRLQELLLRRLALPPSSLPSVIRSLMRIRQTSTVRHLSKSRSKVSASGSSCGKPSHCHDDETSREAGRIEGPGTRLVMVRQRPATLLAPIDDTSVALSSCQPRSRHPRGTSPHKRRCPIHKRRRQGLQSSAHDAEVSSSSIELLLHPLDGTARTWRDSHNMEDPGRHC